MGEELKKVKEELQEVEERSFAMSLLGEFKEVNKRLNRIIIGLLIALAICNIAWVWLWNQYDYTSTNTYEAAGIYALIDSEGNVIAEDVSPETWDKFIEWWRIYGESKNNKNENKDK